MPLLNPTWSDLASYVADRNKHFAELGQGVGAVYDPVGNGITVLTPKAGKAPSAAPGPPAPPPTAVTSPRR